MKITMIRKYNSSAIIIALVVGMIMSVVMIGASLIIGQRIQISAQSRQGKLAYRAAMSGINEGLMLIKQARGQGILENVIGQSTREYTLIPESTSQREIKYEYVISPGGLSGFPRQYVNLTPAEFNSTMNKLWRDNAALPAGLGAENIEKFSKSNVDDVVSVDFPADFDPWTFDIYFSRPHYYNATGVPTYYTGYFTPLNVRLIDNSKGAEEQVVFEKTVTSQTEGKVSIDRVKIALCVSGGKCKLRIKPQVALKGTKLKGAVGAGSPAGKFVYYAVVARNSFDEIIGYEEAQPGVISVESTGYAGQAVRKLQARVDTTTGRYLGLFDFGIYCGDKCDGRGIDEL